MLLASRKKHVGLHPTEAAYTLKPFKAAVNSRFGSRSPVDASLIPMALVTSGVSAGFWMADRQR